jgi:hypothetical protein
MKKLCKKEKNDRVIQWAKFDPIPPQKKIKKKIAVFDIETENWIDFLVLGFYYLNDDTYYSFENMKEAVDFIFDFCRKKNISQIFAHNGGKFDFNFFLDSSVKYYDDYMFVSAIDRGASLLLCQIERISDGKKVTLKDSLAFIPMSLAKAGESYKVDVIKDSVDFKYIGKAFRNEDYLLQLFTDTYIDGKKNSHLRNKVLYRGSHLKSPEDVFKKHGNILNDTARKHITYFSEETKTIYRLYNKEDILEYLKKDCISLAQVINEHFRSELVADAGVAYTSASQAMRIFRRYLKKSIKSSRPSEDEFVRKAYKGGRTEVFKFFFDGEYDIEVNSLNLPRKTIDKIKTMKGKKIKCFDANSLYPTVMEKFKYPMDFKQFFTGKIEVKKAFKKYEFGVFEVKVRVPKTLLIPPLGIDYTFEDNSKKLVFPTGTFSGYWTKYELDYAISLGVEVVEFIKCAVYGEGEYIFKEFINDMYSRRLKAQAEGDITNSTITKLAMNSCYGKFGMNLNDRYIIEGSTDENIGEDYRKINVEKADGTKYITNLIKVKSDTSKMCTKVILACYVTSYSRVLMHKEMMKVGPENIWYTDTDSLFTTEDMDQGKQLGEMKLEYEAGSSCFLAPKTYIIDDIINMKYQTKKTMKGYDKFKSESVTMEEFRAFWLGELSEINAVEKPKFMSFKSATQTGGFLGMNYDADSIQKRYGEQLIIYEKKLEYADTSKEKTKIKNKIKILKLNIEDANKVKWKSIKTRYDKRISDDNLIDTYPIHLEDFNN